VIHTVDAGPAAPGRHRGAAAAGFVLFVVATAWALTADPIQVAPGIPGEIKGDDAVYVTAALSAAFDGNLSFEQRDLERFEGLYHRGPEGIFLKRGKTLHLRANSTFPFIHLEKTPDPHTDRLYFGKALIYPIVAAPFVRAFGLNGLLLVNVVLLAIAASCAYIFLAARSSSLGAALFTTAFFGATALPVYLVFWMPEILNVTLVTVAYFLWAYREVAPTRRLAGAWPQLVAAALLGLHAYSKPFPNPFVIAPLVLTAWCHCHAARVALYLERRRRTDRQPLPGRHLPGPLVFDAAGQYRLGRHGGMAGRRPLHRQDSSRSLRRREVPVPHDGARRRSPPAG
jgi:hypothetical protein